MYCSAPKFFGDLMSKRNWWLVLLLMNFSVLGGVIWLGAMTWDRISGGAATAHIASGADKSRPLEKARQ